MEVYSPPHGHQPAKNPYIVAIASGKGGVGKSFITSNLAMALAKQGKKTVVVDLDLGSANMHTCLGISSPKTTLSSLFSSDHDDINELIDYSSHEDIGLISGAADNLQMANLKHFQKLKIMRQLTHIQADFVILDLGAGTAYNTLDFFMDADQALLAVIPEPTSIENCYRFIKCLVARKLNFLPSKTREVMNQVLSHGKNRHGQPISFSTFLANIQQKFPDHDQAIRRKLSQLQLNLIVNQVLDPSDIKLGPSIAILFDKYFDIKLNVLGHLLHDTQVIHALKARKVYYHATPHAENVQHLNQMALKLIAKKANSHKKYAP